jgi:D-xylose transport system ATP-binding protein
MSALSRSHRRNAQKRFGAVHALKDVSLEAYAGEVLALLGDNGAGKSTLVKCISGVHALDEGEICWTARR